MMIVMLCGKVQMIHQPQRLLESWVQHGTGKQCRIEFFDAIHQSKSCFAEVGQDLDERARIMVRVVRFSITQVGRGKF